MALFKDDTIERFIKITGFDMVALFNDFSLFMEENKEQIVTFFKGEVDTPNKESFDILEDLQTRSKNAIELFIQNKRVFNSFADWNLLDIVEDISVKLDTIANISIYLRSSTVNGKITIGVEGDFVLKENSTIEKISQLDLDSSEFEDDWVDLAIENQLKEEDYTTQGGIVLKAKFNVNDGRSTLDSVVGPLQGENLYGKDINRIFTFNNDDLQVLSPKNTIEQNIDILTNLQRGDNPEFRNDGIKAKLFIGNNTASIGFSILFRQFSDLFSKDDTIESFSFRNVRFEEDGLFIDFEIQTRFGEIFNSTLNLT